MAGGRTLAEQARPPRPQPRQRPRHPTAVVLSNWGIQLVLAAIGIYSLVGETLDGAAWWCMLSTLYAFGAVVVLSFMARNGGGPPAEASRRWLGRARKPIVTIFTVVPALIGILAALQVILADSLVGADDRGINKFLGVWSMLLGWAMLHWGFAQLYLLRSEEARPGKVLDFPESDHPGLVDHVYFAFTVGTTFAASDVTVLDTRTRWVVTIHSVLAFGLNALTIALAFNTIMGLGK